MESKKKDLALRVVLVVAANLILGGGLAVLGQTRLPA